MRVFARALSFTAGALLVLHTSAAMADNRILSERQSDSWYAIHGGTTLGLGLATVGAFTLWPKPTGPKMTAAPAFERFVEHHHSKMSAHVSDATIAAAVLGPYLTQALDSRAYEWTNTSLIYTETLAASQLLNVSVKQTVLRARPYTHGESEAARKHEKEKGADSYYSFYSGHAAMAFTGATAGSYLFAATHEDTALRATHWGASMMLAGFTAHARVRAGKHYLTDVGVGAFLGVAMGLGVPLLHQVNAPVAPIEVLSASGGIVGGTLLAWLLPSGVRDKISCLGPSFTPVAGGGLLSLHGSLF